MSSFLSSCRARRLWLTALLLISPAGALQAPSLAATIGNSQTINFAPQILDLECTFAPGPTGALGIDADKTLIGTENSQVGGSRTSINVFANFQTAQLVLDGLAVSKDGSQSYIPAGSTLFLSGGGQSTSSNSDTAILGIPSSQAEEFTVGVVFSPESGRTTFEAGSYNAQLTLTCTSGGVK